MNWRVFLLGQYCCWQSMFSQNWLSLSGWNGMAQRRTTGSLCCGGDACCFGRYTAGYVCGARLEPPLSCLKLNRPAKRSGSVYLALRCDPGQGYGRGFTLSVLRTPAFGPVATAPAYARSPRGAPRGEYLQTWCRSPLDGVPPHYGSESCVMPPRIAVALLWLSQDPTWSACGAHSPRNPVVA